ncbi:arginine--tRNA ligase [Alkalihalobacillus sp. AL-G]|uniref:arginine--tRNA ligase n=1 Tax=Alkalihalobacillus sp. AL-G TaxID=2926399 RepID=UPI00272A499E|nr:arginine--tRNA ligase [Alkalihalobacillus sp. AL-G]WLD95308.1 arginine--tRNA ligase [Alkalihalobacillus sp. AL-G]
MTIQQLTAKEIAKIITDVTKDELIEKLEIPPDNTLGDLAFPCFILARKLRQSPAVIAQWLEQQLAESNVFEQVKAVGPYLNVFLKKDPIAANVIREVLTKGNQYGSAEGSSSGTITIDLSSPNIAKPFSMGHLRSTVIGNSIANIAEKLGYEPVRINHLGDWGTQFGKLMTAYHKWGDESLVKENPIKELNKLYVRFHEEAKTDETLNDEGRSWFKKLEEGDPEAEALWKWFRDESLKDFQKIYDLLDITFDSLHGEAFYNDKMLPVVEELTEKGLLVESEGAMVVDLSDSDLSPALIKKKDGASLYVTRDLAAAQYRKNTYDFKESLYVVGQEQSLHFEQLKKVLHMMGYEWANDMHHIPFGLILQDGKKMSTRKGKTILLEEVLKQTINQAENNITEKNPTLEDKEKVAEMVGVGAVIFNDLRQSRLNSVEFNIETMLRFEGETGPYVQYTHARACTLLKKGNYEKESELNLLEVVKEPCAWEIILTLEKFPAVVERAYKEYEPSVISRYVIELARYFNQYYGKVRILSGTNEEQHARLILVEAVTIVLNEGLRLLGIKSPQQM